HTTRIAPGAAYQMLLGVVLLCSAALLGASSMVELYCGYFWPGTFPEWVPRKWFTVTVVDCTVGDNNLLQYIVGIAASLFIGITALRRGVTAAQYFQRAYLRFSPKNVPPSK